MSSIPTHLVFRNELLYKILSQPVAPYREGQITKALLEILQEANVPHFQDPVGNIVLGALSKSDYLQKIGANFSTRSHSQEPLRLFIAHMDHPGFHGVRWRRSATELDIQWYGGSPVEHLEKAPVWLANQDGFVGEGHLTAVKLKAQNLSQTKFTIDQAVVKVTQLKPMQAKRAQPQASSLFGGYRFRAPYWQEGDLLYTNGADDRVGVFAILSLALDLFSTTRSAQAPFLGLLTRAEEVGFIGAISHFELGWLQKATRPLFCVSIETSRTLPGAEIGKGPVIRLGDKTTVFSANYLKALTDIAQSKIPNHFQKRIMDGGTCEATAAIAYGFPSIGISVPLGNYHNQSFEGGPDSIAPNGPGPEFVSLNDIQGLIELSHYLIKTKLSNDNPWKKTLQEFKKDLKKAQGLLALRY